MTPDADRILLAYHDLFRVGETEAQRLVLADLACEAYQDRTCVEEDHQGRVDPYRMAFNEGHRALYNKILLRIAEGEKLRRDGPEPPKDAISSLSD